MNGLIASVIVLALAILAGVVRLKRRGGAGTAARKFQDHINTAARKQLARKAQRKKRTW